MASSSANEEVISGSTAATHENQSTFKCEEYDDYLLIQEDPGGASRPGNGSVLEPNNEITEPKSVDSGYEGKQSRTCSPGLTAGVKPESETEVATYNYKQGFFRDIAL